MTPHGGNQVGGGIIIRWKTGGAWKKGGAYLVNRWCLFLEAEIGQKYLMAHSIVEISWLIISQKCRIFGRK